MNSYKSPILADSTVVRDALFQFLDEFPGQKTVHNAVVFLRERGLVVDGDSVQPILDDILVKPINPFAPEINPLRKPVGIGRSIKLGPEPLESQEPVKKPWWNQAMSKIKMLVKS